MKRRLQSPTEQTEINVSPLIDMVFILLIFFIVATSFINEIGLKTNYKDSSLPSTSSADPLAFDLPGSGQILHNGNLIGLEEITPIVIRSGKENSDKIIVRASPGSRAGLATQVMDQAMRGGASKVKLIGLSE